MVSHFILRLLEERKLEFLAFFHLPQLPPGSSRRIVVLIMIAKEIAGKEGPDMILLLAARMVFIAMLSHVRGVGPEIEELEEAHERRNDPKDYEVFLREP